MAWLNVIPEKEDRPRKAKYPEESPETELSFLTSYEQTLVNYWLECGTASSTSAGIVPIPWSEIVAWANQFYSEQYIIWATPSSPLRVDGLPDERYRSKPVPLLATQCTLSDWELQTIKKMSQEYCSEYANNSPSAPCPKEIIVDDLDDDYKMSNANAFESTFMTLFGKGTHAPPAVEAATNNT